MGPLYRSVYKRFKGLLKIQNVYYLPSRSPKDVTYEKESLHVGE